MMTEDEKRFIAYWEKSRADKKNLLRSIYFGLPLGAVVFAGVMINLLSGWYSRATMQLSINKSLIIVIMIALIAIAAFIAIFAYKHKWETNEQQYLELKSKLKKYEEV